MGAQSIPENALGLRLIAPGLFAARRGFVAASRGLVAAVFGLAFTVGTAASAQGDDQASKQAGEASEVLVLDLAANAAKRAATDRSQLSVAISANTRLSPVSDADLRAALDGHGWVPSLRRGNEALAEATTLIEQTPTSDQRQCAAATTNVEVAILSLAAAQAASFSNKAASKTASKGLLRAYGVTFRCANQDGDAVAALAIAQVLRSLGQVDPPKGVDDATWAIHPKLDAAANVTMAAVTIEGPPGSTVWIDHQERGPAPARLYLRQGSHIVAVGSAEGGAARRFQISSWTHTESLELATGRWSKVAKLAAAMRSIKRPADGKAIAELLSLAGVELAVVIVGGGTFEAWRATPNETAKRLGQRRDAAQVIALLSSTLGSRAPDPNASLLREGDVPITGGTGRAESKPTKWWVYAAVLGAATVGAGIIVFGQSRDDRQRFEITLP